MTHLSPALILRGYAAGAFPMARSADDPRIEWFEPRRRGILPLERFHVSRSLARRRRRGGFTFSADRDFAGVLKACADRPETWINADIAEVFQALHGLGLAHSVEVWTREGAFAGGVYGLAMGGAFFAESMVSRVTDGSKMALAELVARLRAGGFQLLDTQYLTPHLASLGGIEIGRLAYRARLEAALGVTADSALAFGAATAADGAFWDAAR